MVYAVHRLLVVRNVATSSVADFGNKQQSVRLETLLNRTRPACQVACFVAARLPAPCCPTGLHVLKHPHLPLWPQS